MVGPQNRGGGVNRIKKGGIKYHYTLTYTLYPS